MSNSTAQTSPPGYQVLRGPNNNEQRKDDKPKAAPLGYQALLNPDDDDDDDDDEERQQPLSPAKAKLSKLAPAATVMLGALLALLAFTCGVLVVLTAALAGWWLGNHGQSTGCSLRVAEQSPWAAVAASVDYCGGAPGHARAVGCRFDVMTYAWQAPGCYDGELVDEFLAQPEEDAGAGGWHWYADVNRTVEVPRDEVLLGQHAALFVTSAYHRAHCAFMWKKLHRAIGRRRLVDSYIGNYAHTAHCADMLLGRGVEAGVVDADVVNTRAHMKYPRCESREVSL
ncbi:hypothetical protein F4780DRAFT_233096 [Xylariomycetidae sp. FL0641]|nr:hypothetical protein F4780DRAFT_233096 [Xylariomycetidae sp. FL0641]